MYDIRFVDAKNHNGKKLRDKKTGDMLEHCPHSYIVHPVFGECEESIFGMHYFREKFIELRGICMHCGEVLTISAENMKSNEEEYNEEIERIVKELDK